MENPRRSPVRVARVIAGGRSGAHEIERADRLAQLSLDDARRGQWRPPQMDRDCSYGFPTQSMGTRVLCKQCGITTFGWGHIEMIGGDYVSISVSALDDLDPEDLVAAPVKYFNGRDNKWWEEPAEKRHL